MQEMPDKDEVRADEPLASRMPGVRRSFGVAGSIALHLILVLPFLVNLSLPSHDKPQEETVSVEIVPPPEPEPKPEPEPPPPEKPEPPAPEPPPPEPQPEPQPEPESKPEPQPEQQAAAPAPPIPTLRPVFKFGEETRGPDQKADGNSAEEAEKPAEPAEQPVEEPKPTETAEAKPTEEKPADKPVEAETGSDMAEAVPQEPPASPEAPVMDSAALALLTAPALSETGASEPGAADVVLPEKVVRPSPRPASATAAAERPIPELQEAKRLYSSSRTGDQRAMTAMAGIPRGERAGQLCASELQAQLRNGSPAYRPELIPAYTLAPGTTALKVGRGAFRAEGAWYDVSFSCQVNADATEIQSFSYAVGSRIPRSEWRARGFPSF
jgi:hypothetical protein